MNLVKLEAQIASKKTLDFGQIFNKSLELFKEVWLEGFITLILTFMCMGVCYVIFYIPVVAGVVVDRGILQQEEPSVVSILTILIMYPILILLIGAVFLALNAAFLRICQQRDLQLSNTTDYFYYFKEGRFKKALILSFYITLLSFLGVLLCGIGLFYVMVPISLVTTFFAFNLQLSATDIVVMSFKLGNKNWLVIFGLLLIIGFLSQLGVLLCGVGFLFTAMLSKVPLYYMYKDGVGFSAPEPPEDPYLIK